VREAIDVKERIVIVSHIGPDGDAVGSSLALYHYLHAVGKTAKVILPNAVPVFYNWMPGAEDILIYEKSRTAAQEFFAQADLIFALDFNAPKRLEQMADAVLQAPAPKILIDHHPYPEDFAQITISYPEISSASELVFRTICRMGHFDKISLPCAQCIMTGMMTDTGGFAFNSNQPEIYTITAELIKLGVDKDDIYRRVFNTFSLGRLKLNAFSIYRKLRLFPKYKTALITLSQEELKKFCYRVGDTEGIVNMPLSIEGIVLSVFMREDAGRIKVSFRSQGTFPANKIAADLFNGGGHLNAAGGDSYASLQETAEMLKKALPDYEKFL